LAQSQQKKPDNTAQPHAEVFNALKQKYPFINASSPENVLL